MTSNTRNNYTKRELNELILKYNNRFIEKSKEPGQFTWLYDTINNKFILRIISYSLKDTYDIINDYLIDERDIKINNIL